MGHEALPFYLFCDKSEGALKRDVAQMSSANGFFSMQSRKKFAGSEVVQNPMNLLKQKLTVSRGLCEIFDSLRWVSTMAIDQMVRLCVQFPMAIIIGSS